MSRETFVLRNGQLVPKHIAAPLHSTHGAGPNIISDTMDLTLNHADGKHYDSKSRYYRAVKAAGCEIVGNDMSAMKNRPQLAEISGRDIKRAIEQLKSQ